MESREEYRMPSSIKRVARGSSAALYVVKHRFLGHAQPAIWRSGVAVPESFWAVTYRMEFITEL